MAKAQTFEWETKINDVPSSGFYKIPINPLITGNLTNNFSDIRIFDLGGHEIPYLLQSDISSPDKIVFREFKLIEEKLYNEYKIIEKKHIKDCCTHMIFRNSNKSTINNISLIIKNFDVRKKVKLSGSDNKKSWYIIKDNYIFQSVYSTSETSEIKIINFPLSNYTFYKIEIDDSNNAPINILKIGYYEISQIIYAPDTNKTDNLKLFINASNTSRVAKLAGSNDKQNWNVIIDSILLPESSFERGNKITKILNFPFCKFLYYNLIFTDSISDPLKIVKAGFFDSYSENEKYTELPEPVVFQKDSSGNKKSYIKISFDNFQYIDKIEFYIDGPVYYLRKGNVSELKKYKVKKREEKKYFQQIKSLELSSNDQNIIYFSNYGIKDLYFIIENEDNRPLIVTSVKAYQLNHFLTAYLEQGKQYKLRFGSIKLNKPVYDLEYFKDSIPENLPMLYTNKIIDLKKTPDEKVQKSFFASKLFIWIAILIVIALLGFMTIKMMKEMK